MKRAARVALVPALFALGVVPAAADPPKGAPVTQKARPSSNPPPPSDSPLRILVEAAPRHVIGFPLLVAVTYVAPLDTSYQLLPPVHITTWRNRLGVRLVPVRGGVAVERRPTPWTELRSGALALGAGQSHRMLFDLANFGLTIQPGVYNMVVRMQHVGGGNEVESRPVTIELVAPSADEAKEAERLRGLGVGTSAALPGQWWPLFDYWGTLTVSPVLGAEARQQLALHLFLHRAFCGPDTPAALDPRLLDPITAPSLQAEVAALRLELAAARHDPAAPRLRQALVARWPGMRHRAEEIDKGDGDIAGGRRVRGPESAGAKTMAARGNTTKPYVP